MVTAVSKRHTSRPNFQATEGPGIDDDDNNGDNNGGNEPLS